MQAQGGMVQFSLEDKHVRFTINLDSAAQGHVKISARLLALARIMRNQDIDPSAGEPATVLPAGSGELRGIPPVYPVPRALPIVAMVLPRIR